MEITQHTIMTERMSMHCRSAGQPDDLPVLLLHGSFATSRWWEPFMSLISEGFYLVAPDLRGCGGSDAPNEDFSIAAQAADVAALVAELGWDEFELIAHSSGGAIAIEYILSHANEVRTLTLVDSVPIEGVFTPVDMFMLLAEMRTDRTLLRNALAALMPTYPIDQEPQATFFAQLVDDAAHMAPPAFTAIAESLNEWNRFAEAHQLTLPTLLIWGDQDSVVDRDSATRSLIAIPGAANLEVLRHVGHSPMIEAPVALAERFIEFVTDDLEDYAQVRRDAL